MGKILLYYKYIDIEKPREILKWQRSLCESLGLKGRIIIAQEGINGTLGGTIEACEQYKKAMLGHPYFEDVDFKESQGGAEYFPRLRIVIKEEIVKLGLDTKAITAKDRGIYLTPKEVHQLIESKTDNIVLLDTRNDYESRIGTFRNAIIPNTKTFREFPAYIDKNTDKFKDKKVVMFCTGGVRCERASAYLKSKNVAKEVFHIKGGIQRYTEEYPNGHFRGKNYVFDSRVTHSVTQDILAHCEHCKISYDEYTNCINTQCNIQIIVCPDCITNYHNTCSQKCFELVEDQKVKVRILPKKIFN